MKQLYLTGRPNLHALFAFPHAPPKATRKKDWIRTSKSQLQILNQLHSLTQKPIN